MYTEKDNENSCFIKNASGIIFSDFSFLLQIIIYFISFLSKFAQKRFIERREQSFSLH